MELNPGRERHPPEEGPILSGSVRDFFRELLAPFRGEPKREKPRTPLPESTVLPGAELRPGVLIGTSFNDKNFTLQIPQEHYESYRALEIERRMPCKNWNKLVHEYVTYRDATLRELAERLTEGARSEEECAQHILEWVRSNIEYDFEEASGKGGDYFRTPIETLYERKGDGEDTTFLYAALCRSIGIDVAVLSFERHIMAGVAGKYGGVGVQHGRTWYGVAETANIVDGAPFRESQVGLVPKQYQGAKTSVTDIPADLVIAGRDASGKRFEIAIPAEKYLAAREYDGPRRLVSGRYEELFERFVTYDTEEISQLARAISHGAESKEEAAQLLLDWVCSFVTYDRVEADGNVEHFRFPIETLFNGLGDCEDSSFLYAALAKSLDIDVALLLYQSHIAVGVAGDFNGAHFAVQGKKYFVAETTASQTEIGAPIVKKEHRQASVFPVK